MANFNGTEGDDTYTGTSVGDTIAGNGGNDTLNGGDGQDLIDGGTGNDRINGGAGADTLRGAAGDDFYTVDDAGDQLIEKVDFGHDMVWSTVTFTLASNLEDLVLTGNAAINGNGNDLDNLLWGNDAANHLVGGEGRDTLQGNGGADVLEGGNGDDIYYLYDAGDVIVEAAGGGTELVISALSYTLADNVENLYLGVDGAIDGTGNGLDNGIDGNDFGNMLSGGGGDDDLIGEGGNDTIQGGSGADTAHYTYASASVQVDLSAGTATGGDGTDTLVSIENVIGSLFDDELRGDAGSNHLNGMDGDDVLDGGAGADILEGALGNDTYYIDSAEDLIIDWAGTNTVYTTVSYVLGAPVDVFRVLNSAGTAAINLTGYITGETIVGNAGVNVIDGYAGDDRLYGGAGNDTLIGGEGLDRLYGGIGNDIYYVNDAYSATTDYVYELAGEGIDTVAASVTHYLRANVENLVLTGSLSLIGKGNELANELTGNAGGNRLSGMAGDDTLYGNGGCDILDGGSGNDTLVGGADNDTYVIDSSSDVIVEGFGEGVDFVYSSASFILSANVDRMYLTGTGDIDATGNELANLLVGNDGANALFGLGANDRIYADQGNDSLDGGEGNDYLEGGAGQDQFTGGAGKDYFVFRDGDFGGATADSADRILDFAYGDRISLSPVDADTSLAGNQAFAFIGTGAFTNVAGQLRYEQLDGDTYLSGDTNGDGVADFMIRLDGLHTLGSGDFIL